MPVKTFEEIYGSLSADEKKLIDNLHAREPELKAGWLRRDDYSRSQNELKAKQAEYDEAVAYKAKMEPWSQEAYDRLHALEEAGVLDPEGKVLWTDQKAELERQLEEAKTLGGDMDPQKLDELVTAKVKEIAKSAGGLTAEEAKALYASESKKLVDDGFTAREAKFNTETIPFIWGGATQVAILANHYEQESGEKWTTKDTERLFGIMNADKNFDALAVEEKFLAPVRDKKKADAEVEERANKRAEEILKARGVSSGMPGGGGERTFPVPPPENPIGLLQRAMSESADKGLPDVRDSVMAGVIEGAKELVEAGKA